MKLKKERKFIIKLFKSKSQYIVIPISRWYKTVLYHWAIYFNLWSLNFQKYSAISYSCITLILNVVCDNTSGFRIWVVFSVVLVSECHFLVIQTHITIKIWSKCFKDEFKLWQENVFSVQCLNNVINLVSLRLRFCEYTFISRY